MIYLALGLVAIIAVSVGWKLTARSSYESAAYQVLEVNEPFEIREYGGLMMATTEMRIASQGNDGSFMRLFRYITGANLQDQKVAMTTPVFVKRVTDQSSGQMGFVIPAEVASDGIPQPSSDKVKIQQRTGGKFAVIRFNGKTRQSATLAAENRLRDWMRERTLLPDGEAEFASYDPPWTPGFLRRNEVLIRIASSRPSN